MIAAHPGDLSLVAVPINEDAMNKVTKILLSIVIVVAIAFVANEFIQRPGGSQSDTDDGALMTSIDANSLNNGTFNTNADAWKLGEAWPVVWSSEQGGGSVRVTAISETGSSGRRVLSQCTNVSGNEIFELGGSFKKDERSTQGGGGRIRVAWHEQADCAGDGKTDKNSASPEDRSGWQHLSTGAFAAPPEARSGRVSIIQNVDGPGEFVAHWDNLYLKAAE